MNLIRLATLLLCAALFACAATRLPAPPLAPLFVESGSGFSPPPRDMAQIVFFAPGDVPSATAANALFEIDGDRRTLLAALAGHGESLQVVKPGHHVFLAWGRDAHLLEANVEAGARYYVLMRAIGPDTLQPLPMRMTEDAEISNRKPESGQWLADTGLVDKTPAADDWFARRTPQIAAAQAAAQSAWQRLSAPERAALTLQPDDAVLR